MMAKLKLSIACRAYDRVAPLIDGSVTVEGCDVVFFPLKTKEIFQRSYDNLEFDVAELSMSSHGVTTERGTSSYIGIPVFISRMFRHSALYIRTDRGIRTPGDLFVRGADQAAKV